MPVNKDLSRFVFAIAAAGLLAFAARSAAADPVTIRSGYTVMVSGFSPLLLEKKDLMQHFGKSYVLDPRHFQSTSLELTALASGEADIVSLGYSTLAVA